MQKRRQYRIFVGSIKSEGYLEEWIYDSDNNVLIKSGRRLCLPGIYFLTLSPDGRYLYCAAKKEKDMAILYAIDITDSTSLHIINCIYLQTSNISHLQINQVGTRLLITLFDNGILLEYMLCKDGSIGELKESCDFTGLIPGENSKNTSHLHSAFFSPDDSLIAVCDMGTNRLNILETEKNGKLKIACSWNVEPSAGPRHTAFSPDGKWLGVAMEKSSELVIMNLKEKKHIMRIPAAPISDENLPADIKFSHDGKHIYLSNRGFDSIGIFSIRTEDNELMLSDLKHIKTKGWPRVIDLGRNEQYLFVMNESYKDYWSGLEIFRVDETGNVLEKVMFHEMPMATAMAVKEEEE